MAIARLTTCLVQVHRPRRGVGMATSSRRRRGSRRPECAACARVREPRSRSARTRGRWAPALRTSGSVPSRRAACARVPRPCAQAPGDGLQDTGVAGRLVILREHLVGQQDRPHVVAGGHRVHRVGPIPAVVPLVGDDVIDSGGAPASPSHEVAGERNGAIEPVGRPLPAFGFAAEPLTPATSGQNSSRCPVSPSACIRNWRRSQPAGWMLPSGSGRKRGAARSRGRTPRRRSRSGLSGQCRTDNRGASHAGQEVSAVHGRDYCRACVGASRLLEESSCLDAPSWLRSDRSPQIRRLDCRSGVQFMFTGWRRASARRVRRSDFQLGCPRIVIQALARLGANWSHLVSEPLTPEHILQTGLAFWASKTLLSAIEMGLFTELAADRSPSPRFGPAGPASAVGPRLPGRARRPRLPDAQR